jgi:hypothetical protein
VTFTVKLAFSTAPRHGQGLLVGDPVARSDHVVVELLLAVTVDVSERVEDEVADRVAVEVLVAVAVADDVAEVVSDLVDVDVEDDVAVAVFVEVLLSRTVPVRVSLADCESVTEAEGVTDDEAEPDAVMLAEAL